MTNIKEFVNVIRESLKYKSKLDYFILVITFTGLTLDVVITRFLPQTTLTNYLVSFLSFCGVLFLLYFGAKDNKDSIGRKVYRFSRNSREAADFFYRWYKQPGEHFIFCTDTEWLEPEAYSRVREVLLSKGKNLSLFIKKANRSLVRDLYRKKCHIYIVDKDINSEHTFSVILSNGQRSIIIRNKQTPIGRFTEGIIEIECYDENPPLVNVSLDMIEEYKSHPYQKKDF